MAITILQEPTSPNVSNTNLIYTVSSSNIPQFQYRYIADLYYSGSATKLARFKYPQNSSGTVNIDMGRPIGDYLETKYDWDIATIEANADTLKEFTIQFGEEYGTSYNSAVTTFENEASASITVLKGNIQYPSTGDYDYLTNTVIPATSSLDWNYYSYIEPPVSSPIDAYNRVYSFSDHYLTNDPNKLNSPATSKYNLGLGGFADDGSYGGVNFMAAQYYDNFDNIGWWVAKPIGTTDIETISWDIYRPTPSLPIIYVSVYNDDLNEIFSTTMSAITGYGDSTLLTVQSNPVQAQSAISSSAQWNFYVIRGLLGSISSVYPGNRGNIGPQFYYNEDKGPSVLLNATIANPSTTKAIPLRGIKPSLWASGKYYPTNCKGEKTRFAFVNSFGVWDYYNVYMPTRRVTNIDRKMYEQERINLNDRIATYNVSNRGEVQYYTEYTDEFEITTDIIDDKESQWLREMFESSDVFIQSGSDFIPINILNNTETIINNKARNKNYQYTIRYQFSNLREPR